MMNTLDSQLEAQRVWRRGQRAGIRWSLYGAIVGLLGAVVAFAPASWLAQAVATATDERLLLAEATGTVWSGNAVVVLTGGPGSRDAATLPGRVHWSLGIARSLPAALELRASHACCVEGELRMRIEPGWRRLRVALPAEAGTVGRWPAAWLAGLGAPWNTVQLGGIVQLTNQGLAIEAAGGRWKVSGAARLDLRSASSRLAAAEPLGSYSVGIGPDATGDGVALTLSTLEGSLQLAGTGRWAGQKLQFRGSARAAPGSEGALNHLLNLIGPRRGAEAVISIG